MNLKKWELKNYPLKILVDTIYIHSLGGKVLLDFFLKSISSNNLNEYFFLFDSRLEKKLFIEINEKNYKILNASESERKTFYKKNNSLFRAIFCFANVPPPIRLNIRTFIYFHNDLLIDFKQTNFSLLKKSVFLLKRLYIKFNDRDNYNWIVQTGLIKNKLRKKIVNNKNRIRVLPFYFDDFKNLKKEKLSNSFLYVSGFLPHKNHDRLIKAFVLAAKKFKNNIHLNLTLKNDDFINLMKPFSKIPSNLFIENLGVLNLEGINLAYENNQNLIFPSLKESFGLPLIEATLKNLNVITSNLDYVNYVIKPSLSFNPLDIDDISNSINNILTLDTYEKPKLISKNKIDELINLLTSV